MAIWQNHFGVSLREWDLYFITDSRLTRRGVFADAETAISAGCKVLQYREKNLSSSELLKTAKELRKTCAGRADFIVDDRLDIAMASRADGLHIGLDDLPVEVVREFMPDAIVGYTVHSVADATAAQEFDFDYLSLGHIFPTTTKFHGTSPLGLAVLREVRKVCKLPLAAIGGINSSNVAGVIEAGADYAAVVSAIASSQSAKSEVEKIRATILESKRRAVAHANTA